MNHSSAILSGIAAVTAMAVAASLPASASADYTDSTSPVLAFADPDNTLGESTLRRTADGILVTLQANAVEPGHAITLWWVVFNQPQNCSAPDCGPDDIFVGGDPIAGLDADAIANADAVASYAAGTVASTDGTVSMASRLTVGEPGVGVIFGDGAVLKDAAAAEVHLVTRSHGPAVTGNVVDQTTSFDGGCDTMLNPPERADAEGECVDLHFSVHQP
jgi:hypothetical protein